MKRTKLPVAVIRRRRRGRLRDRYARPQQFDLFGEATASRSKALIGIKIKLSLTDTCCENVVTLGSSKKAMHAVSMRCTGCGKFRGWLGNEAAAFISATRAKFGAPDIIVLRTTSLGGRADHALFFNQRTANDGRTGS